MKRGLIFLVVLSIVVSISLVSAIETNLKQEYQPGETLIISIEGNFIDNLKPENIQFYSGRIFIPLIYDLAKINDKYYLYAILPGKERNYTLIIKNAHYLEANQEKFQDLQFNFAAKGNSSLFSVNPGFIIANKEFKIKITPIKSMILKTNFLNSTQEFSISGEKTLIFPISGIEKSIFTFLALEAENTKYEIPVAVFSASIITAKSLKFSSSELNLTTLKDTALQFELNLINTGQENLTAALSTDLKEITINPKELFLAAGSSEKINLTIKSEKKGVINGTIKALSSGLSAETFITLTTIEDKKIFQEIINSSGLTAEESCSDLHGKICKENEKCTEEKLTLGGILCCIGNCEKEKASGNKTIAIILIIIVLLIIAFFVYRRLRLRKMTSKEILKAREKDYESRFKPQEIKGGLTRT